jgi:hypothetical protein
MDQAELEWKKLRPECDMLLARKIEGKIAKFVLMTFVGVLQYSLFYFMVRAPI